MAHWTIKYWFDELVGEKKMGKKNEQFDPDDPDFVENGVTLPKSDTLIFVRGGIQQPQD